MNPSAGSRFLDLVERSVIVQAIVTLALVAAVIYLAVTQQPIPQLLEQLTLLVLGFYFGARVANSTARAYFAKEH
jgi:uncharacterized membrane protein